MGREIRRVPPNWEHPKDRDGNYQPMFDEVFDHRMEEWIEGYHLWKSGKHESYNPKYAFYEWEGGPPDPDYYRPDFGETATWFQVYETVSEGTPVSPPFETKEELVDYLSTHGTFWDYKPWSRENATDFVKTEWRPSGLIIDGKFYTPKDINLEKLRGGKKNGKR